MNELDWDWINQDGQLNKGEQAPWWSMAEFENGLHTTVPPHVQPSTTAPYLVKMWLDHGGTAEGAPAEDHTHDKRQLQVLNGNPTLASRHLKEAHNGGNGDHNKYHRFGVR